ncbi:epidermal growth factor-like protein 7 isoform X2 [Pezoporus wallicus]|uniref:epidermal growth factor-like protein 7 isoform X2 n=1 Tax=Pezoporus wallicus TaxID=35540 RepID=UPI00254E01D4|nr:epidermal growth factor-like protein 7 isoform X2 [Pezoporus wallicus]XP_061332541.1 epidermal growth factor-like protein 7 isoform X2 [Pezoporus flaviventris]
MARGGCPGPPHPGQPGRDGRREAPGSAAVAAGLIPAQRAMAAPRSKKPRCSIRKGPVPRTNDGAQRMSRRVCATGPRSRAVASTESHVQPVYQPYLTTCQGHLCSTYRTIYRVAYRQVYRQLPQPVASCCPGWSRADGHALGCNRDVDECAGQSHGCSQLCLNTAGSFQCACRDGFSLTADRKSCQPLVPAPEPGAFSHAGPPSEVKEELKELRSRVEALEQKLQLVLAPFHNLMPSVPEDVGADPISRLSHSLQQLDRIESLSEQISFLEERLETCSCKNEL